MFFQEKNEEPPEFCLNHPEVPATLKCLEHRGPEILICDKCYEKDHKDHFSETMSNNDLRELIEVKKVEVAQQLRDVTRKFDLEHSRLQQLEKRTKYEITEAYRTMLESIDPQKHLNRVSVLHIIHTYIFFFASTSNLYIYLTIAYV